MTINVAAPAFPSMPSSPIGVNFKQRPKTEDAAIANVVSAALAASPVLPFTRHIQCVPYGDIETLSTVQHADLRFGQKVVEAYWKAVQADPLWCTAEQWPMFRCIRTALAVRDVFHAVGRKDAFIAPVGLKLVRLVAGVEVNCLTIGDPGTAVIRNKWNAHMIVRLGDFIFDPSHGQIQRTWNAAPDALAIPVKSNGIKKVSLYEMGKANAVTHCSFSRGQFDFELTYFKLTRSVVGRTRDWSDSPDASPRRRQSVVQAAVEIFRKVDLKACRDAAA